LKDETLWNELMNTYRYIGAMPGSIIRALRDAGRDPDDAQGRSEEVVEHYQQ
jgi:hypothetical protein